MGRETVQADSPRMEDVMRSTVYLSLLLAYASSMFAAIQFRNDSAASARLEVKLTSGSVVFRNIIPRGRSVSWGINGTVYQVTFLKDHPTARTELASMVTRNVDVVTLRQSGSKYNVQLTPSLPDKPMVGNCRRGLTIGNIRGIRAFAKGGTVFFLSGNLRNVPLGGDACVCGTLVPPKGKGDFNMPTLHVANICP